MNYLLWLYLAGISNRFRRLGILLFRLSVLALAVEHLTLATPSRPQYYMVVEHLINQTWLLLVLSGLVILLPSSDFIFGLLSLIKRDNFMRNSILIKLLRLVKYMLKHDLLNMQYRQSLYQRLVTRQRIKWLAIAWYLYDLYRGYKKPWTDLIYLVTGYFGFAGATWLYVRYTGASLYYYPSIANSFDWAIAIISFLIFKVIFLPDFKVIGSAAIKIGLSIAFHKLGLARAESKLEDKLATYQQKYGAK